MKFFFVSIAVIDSGTFKGSADVIALSKSTRNSLIKYVDLAREMCFASDYRIDIGSDVMNLAVPLQKHRKGVPEFHFFHRTDSFPS